MGSNTFLAIFFALLVSPYLALVILVPYLIHDYRVNKIIYLRRSINIYLMVMLLLSAYFMTMLPFPMPDKVAKMTTPYFQLVPFMTVHDFFTDSGIVTNDYSTFLPSLKSGAFLGPFFNLIMLMPFGYFLKEIFDFDLKKTTLFCFGTSMIFELTQLSGLFFIYPRPYRMFDVDDLIINTLGGVAGWLLAPVVKKYSPITKRTLGRSFKKGGGISLRRRLPAIFIDQSICMVMTWMICIVMKYNLQIKWDTQITRHFLNIFMIFMGANLLMGIIQYAFGTTPGQSATGIRLRGISQHHIHAWQYILHTCIMGFYVSLPFWIGFFLGKCQIYRGIKSVIFVFLNAIVTLMYAGVLFGFFVNGIIHGSSMYYDRICQVYLGLSEKERKMGRQRQKILCRGRLNRDNIESFGNALTAFLTAHGYKQDACYRVETLAKSALEDWLADGLEGCACELHFDNRIWRKTLILMVITDKSVYVESRGESFVESVSRVRLSYEQYRADGAYIFALDVP